MKKLQRKEYEQIKAYINRNARSLDLAIWKFHFEEGAREDVLQALSYYQNEDGGFGHALEADSWNPNSSPLTTSTAVEILFEIGMIENDHPIVQGILKYLGSGKDMENGKWTFSVPSSNDYPCAPWWLYSKETNQAQNFNPTGILIGFILTYGDKESSLYEQAMDLGKEMIERLKTTNEVDFHEIGAYVFFFEQIGKLHLEECFSFESAKERLNIWIKNSLEQDPMKWGEYTARPSIMGLDSSKGFLYEEYKDVIHAEVDYLIDLRNKDGVWDITWQWGAHPKEFAISEQWWKCNWIHKYMKIIKEFACIEK